MNRFYELRNIALGKVASQSTTYIRKWWEWIFYQSHQCSPQYGNDGDFQCRSSSYRSSYSSTTYEANPYWKVDLQSSAVVLIVSIKNRDDNNGYLINPFDIRVGNTAANGGRNNPICVQGARITQAGVRKNFTCPETEGRYVSIHLARTQYLQLCEVEVYGIYL